jgi:hypothetical protein
MGQIMSKGQSHNLTLPRINGFHQSYGFLLQPYFSMLISIFGLRCILPICKIAGGVGVGGVVW